MNAIPVYLASPSETQAGSCPEIILRRGEIRHWGGDRRGLTFVAREGALWITQENDPQDFVIAAGETFRVTHRGRVVVQSLAAEARLAACHAA